MPRAGFLSLQNEPRKVAPLGIEATEQAIGKAAGRRQGHGLDGQPSLGHGLLDRQPGETEELGKFERKSGRPDAAENRRKPAPVLRSTSADLAMLWTEAGVTARARGGSFKWHLDPAPSGLHTGRIDETGASVVADAPAKLPPSFRRRFPVHPRRGRIWSSAR